MTRIFSIPRYTVGEGCLQADDDSLVPGDISLPDWEFNNAGAGPSAQLPKIQRNAEKNADGDYLHYLNYDGAAPSYGYIAFPFVAPAGATSATFTVPVKLPTGIGAARCRIAIFNTDMSAYIAYTDVDATADLVDYTVSGAVVAGTMYRAGIYVNHPTIPLTQARVLVGAVTVAVSGATGLFSSPYVRIGAPVGSLHDDGFGRRAVTFQSSAMSRFVFDTDAENLIVELYSTIYGTYPLSAAVSVAVNGRQYTDLFSTANNILQQFSLAMPAGQKRVEITISNTAKPAASILGTYLAAVYAPQSRSIAVVPPATRGRGLVIYGDSTSQAPGAPHLSLAAQLRQHQIVSVGMEGYGSRSLKEDYDTDNTFYTLIRLFARFRPTDIWLAIGTNDYGSSLWTAADFGTAYATLLDNINALMPGVRIWCQTPLSRGSEVANGLGDTLPAYRTQISTAVSTRTAFATLVDGTAIMSANTTHMETDLIHPNELGHARYAAYIRTTI